MILSRILPESPTWLYDMQRPQEADPIVKKLAKVNKTILPDHW